jgi:hypothetical protein
MTGAVDAIDKIKKGLSDHPQVAAVLRRQNEEVELDEIFNGTKQDLRKIARATDNALKKRSAQIQKMLKSKTNEKGRGLTDFEFDHISDEGDAIAAELVYRKKGGKDPISDDIPSHLKKFVSEDLDEGLGVAEDVPAMEVGTDRYREYASDLTPGETDPEWVQARDFKVASMKEALAKVWGLDEKALDKSSKEGYDEEDEQLKPVKGSKTMTGGKVAKVDTKPKLD